MQLHGPNRPTHVVRDLRKLALSQIIKGLKAQIRRGRPFKVVSQDWTTSHLQLADGGKALLGADKRLQQSIRDLLSRNETLCLPDSITLELFDDFSRLPQLFDLHEEALFCSIDLCLELAFEGTILA